jgi:DNA polymerase-3 subunit alpha
MKVIKEVDKYEAQEFLYNIDVDDSKIYEEVNNPNIIGVFQLSGKTAIDIVKRIRPKNFDDLNACSALARPGTSSFVEDYIRGRDEGYRKYPETVSQLLEKSNTVVLFQEQVMSIFNKIGGFSLEETDKVRKLMKRLGKAEKDPEDVKKWDKIVKRFTKGAVENGLSEQDARGVAEDLVRMSEYNFNLAHASAYSYIAVMTLYLSYYFRKYFLSSELEYEIDKDKNIIDAVGSVRARGYILYPPEINTSGVEVKPYEDGIIFGLSNIKQVSKDTAKHIIDNRPYYSLFDFITKTNGKKISINKIKALISVGAFDKLEGENRKKLLQIIDSFWAKKKSIKVVEKLWVKWNEAVKAIESLPGIQTTLTDYKNFEKEYLGGNFFASVFTDKMKEAFVEMKNRNLIYYSFDEVGKVSRKVPVVIEDIRTIHDKNGNEMAFITIEDVVGKVKSVPVFASYWKHIKHFFEVDKAYLLNLFLDDKGDILFGQKGWIDNPAKMRRMVKAI